MGRREEKQFWEIIGPPKFRSGLREETSSEYRHGFTRNSNLGSEHISANVIIASGKIIIMYQ